MQLALFGTEDYPIAISSLTDFSKCAWRAVVKILNISAGEPSEAADTGTAAGKLIEYYHRGVSIEDALKQVKIDAVEGCQDDMGPRRGRPFPLADLARAEKVFRRYATDARNPVDAVPVWSLEQTVSCELPPHDLDPTGKPVRLVGHIDQLRYTPLGFELWDVKLSKRPGTYQLSSYAMQQAAYLIACKNTFKDVNVFPGGIIHINAYVTPKANENDDPSNCPVFVRYPFPEAHFLLLLDSIRLSVALARRGEVTLCPGDFCEYCSMKGGLTECLATLAATIAQ